MNSFAEPITDIFMILDANGCILRFAPVNPLPPFTYPGDLLREVYRDLVPGSQLDSLLAQMHDALKTRHKTNSVFDLQLGNVTKGFLALFLPINKARVMMIIRDVTKYQPFQNLILGQIEEMLAFSRIAKIVFSNYDPEQTLKLVIDEAATLVHANHVSILLCDHGELVTAARGGVNTIDYLDESVNLEIDKYVLRAGKPIRASGVKKSDATPLEFASVPQSILAAPLVLNNKTIGVMEAITNKSNMFGDDDLRLLTMAANWVAMVVANARPLREVAPVREKYQWVLATV